MKKITPQNETDIIMLFREGKNNTVAEISEKLKLNYFVVNNCLTRYLEKPDDYIRTNEEYFEIYESKMNEL